MGWLLGCFKCRNRPKRGASYRNQAKFKNQTAVAGNVSCAASSHAFSLEDLYSVRKSPTESSATVSSSYDIGDPFESCPPSLRSQAQSKKSEVEKCSRERNDANKTDHSGGEWSHVDELNEELESLRRKLMQEADAAKKLSDEVKYLRACRELLESPPKAFKVTFDKLDKGSTDQVDRSQHSWLLSSVLTRIQPSGLVVEACSTPSSPFQCLPEGCSLENRAIRASWSGDFQDSPRNGNNVLKCAELNLFRVESGVYDELINGINESNKPTQCAEDCISRAGRRVQSPPWTFSEAKLDVANHKNSQISEDLLLEHIDVSSLIKDSELITDWENSFGELDTQERSSGDQSLIEDTAQLPGQEEEVDEEDGLDAKSCFIESRQRQSATGYQVGEALSSSSGMLNEAEARHNCTREHLKDRLPHHNGDGQTIYATEGTNMDSELEFHTDILLSQAGFCTGTEESSNDTASQSCFSPQFSLSKRFWSSKRKSAPEREASIFSVAGNLPRNDSDVHEVPLSCTHPAMQQWQQVESSENDNHPFLDALSQLSTECSEKRNDCSGNSSESAGVQLDQMNHSSGTSTSAQQGFSHVSSVEDETVARRYNNLNLASLVPTEAENGAQRKKLRLEVNSLSERVLKQISSQNLQHGSVLVEEEQARALDSAFGDGHENGSAAGTSISKEALDSKFLETSVCNSLSNEKEPASSTASSPSSQTQTPPKFMGSHPSPARLADDRPILGTVAAHWSHISTRKWWDGKGIPNSTNKYKEDQRVSWHAIPFEVRLEQALANQDCVLPK